MAGQRKPRTPKAGTYTDGVNPTGYPETEHIPPAAEAHGFKVGDRVEFVEDFAPDVPAGRRALVDAVDSHPVMPITVHVHNPAGGFFFTPVKPSEIRKVDDEQPNADAVGVPEDAPEGGPEALSGVAA